MITGLEFSTSLDKVVLSEELPPLVLIAFTRPDLLKEVIEAINQQSLLPPKIIAFVDGKRGEEDEPLIEKCILLLEQLSTSIPVHITRRSHNLGGTQNAILGLTEALSNHKSVVYLEDDTVPNRYFYDRMCRLLETYSDHRQVCSVSAYANYPAELKIPDNTDFIASNRVFSWGLGLWSDRWKELDLVNQSGQYNPFGSFYNIPATSQTKMTMINQFWLEKNRKTDWVITFTLAALYHQKVHITPTNSFTFNIGFGHPNAQTYRGQEQAWVNSKYDEAFYPNNLPHDLVLPDELERSLSDIELAQHLLKHNGLWLDPLAFLHLFRSSRSLRAKALILKMFITQLPIALRRWRSGLSI